MTKAYTSGDKWNAAPLEKYYEIKRGADWTQFHCKECAKAWRIPSGKLSTFNPLHLFNHAYSHKEAE